MMTVKVPIIIFIWLSILVHITLALSQTFNTSELDLSHIQLGVGFHPSSKDLYLLSQSNFTKCVLRSRDPWVVIPLAGDDLEVWKRLAERLRGVAFFGIIDITQDTSILYELNFPIQSSAESRSTFARVYPYGKANIKERQYQDVNDPDDVQNIIVQSLPSNTMTSVGNDEELNEFLMNCLLNSPTKFPAVFIVDREQTVPAPFITISERLQRYFSFSHMDSTLAWTLLREVDSDQIMLEEEISRPPGLVVVIAHLEQGSFSYQIAVHHTESNDAAGEHDDSFSYFSIFKFLFKINNEHREYLPGNNMAEDEEVALMEDVLEAERKRFRFIPKRSKPKWHVDDKGAEHSSIVPNNEL